MELLALAILFLVSTVVIVPIFQKLNLGSVLGYLIAGMLIGPSGIGLVKDPGNILHFSEFGVIFLMFVIGLELQPSRLWVMRKSVFGLGFAQLAVTTAAIFLLSRSLGLDWKVSLVFGLGLSMSSTALVLQSLAERNQLAAQHGRDAFSILLFQDLAVIPILAFLPLLASAVQEDAAEKGFLIPFLAILGFVIGGRYLLRPAFKWIASVKNREMFTAASLLIVVGAAAIMQSIGLSMGLGAFLAGVLLADSEYRHELEADIEPFKGLLLGLFFISIGMSVKTGLVWERPLEILGLTAALFFLKGAVLFAMKKISKSGKSTSARKLAIYLCQGGEFAFVVFAAASTLGILSENLAQLMTIVVTASMILAPLLFVLEDKVFSLHLDADEKDPAYDTNFDENPVVIAGFGRFGQIVGRLLTIRKIRFTAMDKSSQHVDFIRRFGNKIFYGDATRLELLHSAKVGSAKLFVLAIDNVDESLKTAELVRKHFPHVPIIARARNRFHSYKLLDLGIETFYRDTFFSSLEMGKSVLGFLGMAPVDIERLIQRFKKYDEELLKRQHAVYQDESQLIQTSRQAASDLESLFENDSTAREDENSDPIS